MKTETVKDVVENYRFHGSSGKQTACITFVNGLFHECRFNTEQCIYSKDDWQFLHEICHEIERIIKENK